MGGGKGSTRHWSVQRTLGSTTKSGAAYKAANFGEPSLDEINTFISCLPNGPEKYLAVFVFATAADPETAVSLEVARVEELWAEFGTLGAMQQLANVPVDPEWELLLPIYIRGRRTALLRRRDFRKGEKPKHVYLGRDGRPMTVQKANAALVRASKRMNFDAPITLETIARAVMQSWYENSMIPNGTFMLQ